ncbi:MAG TPA: homoserine kinase [Aggregatilineales bacterium]|nr:homoserine kinase [Aggregatilineales bacterium]
MTTVRVRVPASSANLGPGFDSLALALALYNTVEVTALPGGGEPVVRVEVSGEGAEELPTDSTNAVVRAMEAVYARAGQSVPRLHVRLENAIPLQSGLGSSASACAAGVAAANALLGEAMDRHALFRLTADLEGHPDNASGAVFGGLTASSRGASGFVARRLPLAPDLRVAVALPAVRLSTPQQRAALPSQVPFADAAANIGRALLVAQALADADYALLAEVMCDRLHEPYRTPHIPGVEAAIAAAREAGAAAVALSGSGPALITFAPANHSAIAEAMREAFRRAGVEARVWTLPVDQEGVVVTARQERSINARKP